MTNRLFIDQDGDACLEPADRDNNLVALPARDDEGNILNPDAWAKMVRAFNEADTAIAKITPADARAAFERAVQEAVDAERARLGPISQLLPRAVAEAEKAMVRFPQPNYVISKWAEETGEVTKAMIHYAERRDTAYHVLVEIIQTLAMLHRLIVEGDEVHGMDPLSAGLSHFAIRAPQEPSE